MKLKPHGLFYLVPIGLLLTGIALAVIFFYQAVVVPLMNIEEISMNRSYEFIFSEGSFVSLFIEDDELTSYEVSESTDMYLITYVSKDVEYKIELDIINLGEDDQSTGYHVTELSANSTYTFDQYLNFTDITFDQDGEYLVRLVSYDDLPGTFGFAYSDYDTAAGKLMTATLGLVIGVGGALVSFIVLLIFRSKYKHSHIIESNNENSVHKDEDSQETDK